MRFTGTDVDDVVDEEDALLKDTTFPEGAMATYSCERGFELLGPTRRECQGSMWMPEGVPFCGKFSLTCPRDDFHDDARVFVRMLSENFLKEKGTPTDRPN